MDESVDSKLIMDNKSNYSDLSKYNSTYSPVTYLNYPVRDSLCFVIPLTFIYSLILISGILGNVITCIVITRNKNMHTATNYYLFSLAISDLLLLVSGLPQEIYNMWYRYPYPFDEAVCILQGFAAETSSNATVLTITAFTLERTAGLSTSKLKETLPTQWNTFDDFKSVAFSQYRIYLSEENWRDGTCNCTAFNKKYNYVPISHISQIQQHHLQHQQLEQPNFISNTRHAEIGSNRSNKLEKTVKAKSGLNKESLSEYTANNNRTKEEIPSTQKRKEKKLRSQFAKQSTEEKNGSAEAYDSIPELEPAIKLSKQNVTAPKYPQQKPKKNYVPESDDECYVSEEDFDESDYATWTSDNQTQQRQFNKEKFPVEVEVQLTKKQRKKLAQKQRRLQKNGHTNNELVKDNNINPVNSKIIASNRGTEVNGVTLPPGITVSRVNPATAKSSRDRLESRISQPVPPQEISLMHTPSTMGVSFPMNMSGEDSNSFRMSASTPHVSEQQLLASAKSKQKKQKDKTKKAVESHAAYQEEKLITLRNPLFHTNSVILQGLPGMPPMSAMSAQLPEIIDQPATITTNKETGMCTIRSMSMHQGQSNASGFGPYGHSQSYIHPESHQLNYASFNYGQMGNAYNLLRSEPKETVAITQQEQQQQQEIGFNLRVGGRLNNEITIHDISESKFLRNQPVLPPFNSAEKKHIPSPSSHHSQAHIHPSNLAVGSRNDDKISEFDDGASVSTQTVNSSVQESEERDEHPTNTRTPKNRSDTHSMNETISETMSETMSSDSCCTCDELNFIKSLTI
ncbi:Pyrokinin-1 receptor [Pseudolycoriella hygida]|uniref:Pyrokinin-1 receptor n=1 Tax=Pseudolycoriella hygida TaxID=35572 RepID=A0A9Q0MXM6_9DIPT|nr:Pyrokinin-1 receptor [Pseudolycoriella hygida]